MRSTLLIIIVILSFNLYSQEREVIELDRKGKCNKYIGKKSYKDLFYTKSEKLFSHIFHKNYYQFGYKENVDMIVFSLDSYLLTFFSFDDLFLYFNEKKYKLNEVVDFEVKEVKSIDGSSDKYFIVSYRLNEELQENIVNAETISFGLYNDSKTEIKQWNLSNSEVNDFKESMSCYLLNVEQLKEIYKIERKEYLENLKEFKNNFRDHKWGDSLLQVKEKENDVTVIKDNLVFDVLLNGEKYKAFLFFTKNKLYRGVYQYENDFTNPNEYFYKYIDLRELLTKKYGLPVDKKKNIKGDLFSAFDDLGTAIQLGYYSESYIWETKKTFIILNIDGVQNDVEIQISYLSKDEKLQNSAKSQIEKESLEGF